MNLYFIDYENVHKYGLKGITGVLPYGRIIIFYRDDDPTIRHLKALIAKCDSCPIELYQHSKTGTNYVDFQIDTYLGFMIGRYVDIDSIYIISCDKGYQAVRDFWEGKGIKILRQPTISGEPLPGTILAKQKKASKAKKKKKKEKASKLPEAYQKSVITALSSFSLTDKQLKNICRCIAMCRTEKKLHNALNTALPNGSGKAVFDNIVSIYRKYLRDKTA